MGSQPSAEEVGMSSYWQLIDVKAPFNEVVRRLLPTSLVNRRGMKGSCSVPGIGQLRHTERGRMAVSARQDL